MKETLIKLLVQNLCFLELSDDEIVDPDSAIKEMENIASELASFSDEDIASFIEFVSKIAEAEEASGQPPDRVEFIKSIPEAVGLIDVDED